MGGNKWFVGGIVGVLLLTALALNGGAPSIPPSTANTSSGDVVAALPENRDTELYRAVISRMESGESYYLAVSELHRERSYPLYPFFTVRPPTLAWMSTIIDTMGLYLLAWLTLLATISVWYLALRDQTLGVRAAFVGLLALGGASTITPAGIVLHEFWCGLLITLSLAFMRDDQWRWRLLFAALALSIREFALAFVFVLGFVALVEKRWPEVIGAGIVTMLFGAGMFLHFQQVELVRLVGDLQSPAWTGLRGPGALVADISQISWTGLFPTALAALLTFLPLLGWCFAKQRWRALLWFVGFGAAVAIFARPNNNYWVLVLLPAYLAGLAFLVQKPARYRNAFGPQSD